jgi:parallel beta-helix repeat protein
MIGKKNKLLITIFLVIFLYSSLYGFDEALFKVKRSEKEYLNYNHIKISNLYETTIQIDDLPSSNFDWEWAESQSWCSGSGTEIDPYIIENHVFAISDSGATCLSIKNSEKYFIIENCSFFDTLFSGSGSGVYLYNVTNAKVINSSVHHKYQGIYLDHSYNNLISGNILTYNQERGILTVESDNNNMTKNQVSFNRFGFFLGGGSDYNRLSDNNCSENSYGIKLYYADYNSFINFKLVKNGINIERSNYNNFSEIIVQNSGVTLLYSHHTSFKLNDIINSGGSGFDFAYSNDNNIISSKILSSGSTGIVFYESQRNEMVNNLIDNSGEYGIRLYRHLDGAGSCYNDFVNNSILNSNKHGIYLYFSGLNNFYNNTIQGNKESGFYADTSHLVNFENNIVSYNTLHGVDAFCDSLYNVIGNDIRYNGLNGLYLHRYSDLYNISDNFIIGNLNVGLLIQDSSHFNNIFNNFFVNNGLNADDSESDNYWNCSYIGNYWSDYSGVDENEDGIGDTPYIVGQGTDYLPIWRDGPKITVRSPIEHTLYSNPPEFNITILDSMTDKKWYTIHTSLIKYYFTQNGTIDASAWYNCSDGNVIIKFFANDTLGNENSKWVNVLKDTESPAITINSPILNQVYGAIAPEFNITIFETYSINKTWYTINGGLTKYTSSGLTGSINQSAWNEIEDDNIILRFYSNDSVGNLGFKDVNIIKDTTAPKIIINTPTQYKLCGIDAPTFSLTIDEPYLHQKLYSFNGRPNITFTSQISFNQTEWNRIGNGTVLITFYAIDTAGNVNSSEVIVRKDAFAPVITIHSPRENEGFVNPPNFNISIIEEDLDSVSYSLWSVAGPFPILNLTGTIDKDAWERLSTGLEEAVILIFAARDRAGNVGSESVLVWKASPLEPEIPGYNIFILLCVFSISIVIVSKRMRRFPKNTPST